MTPEFMAAFDELIELEGGVSDDADDPGGKTIYGISSVKNPEAFAEVWNAKDRLNEARLYYWHQWWDKHTMQRLPPMIAKRLFSTAVNMGYQQAVKLLQRALRAATGEPLKDDGVLGPVTQAAIDNANPLLTLTALRSEQAAFYRLLIAKNPALARFEGGWLNRAYA